MAKVKTAKDRITAYLTSKGLDAAEIKDAFADLDAADVTLTQAADAISKNEQWVTWYNQVVPEVQKTMSERDQLKQRLDALEKAGVKFGDPATAEPVITPNGNYVKPEDLEKFKREIAGANSAVIKNGLKLSFKHYKKFGSDVNWEEVEQLMADGKASNMDEAYRQWSEPEYEKSRKEETDKFISEGIKKGIQDEITKRGYTMSRKRTDDVENAPLDKPAPAEKDLRDAFIADLNSETTH